MMSGGWEAASFNLVRGRRRSGELPDLMPKPPRILFFSPEFPPQPGGAGRFSYGLATGLAHRSLEVAVLTASLSDPSTAAFDAEQPFRTIRRRLDGSSFAQYLRGAAWLQAEIWKTRPDALVVTDLLAHRIVCLGLSLGVSKLIVLAHGTDSEMNFSEGHAKRMLFTRLYSLADRIIANSRYTRGLLAARGVRRPEIDVILPGIDIPLFSRTPDASRISKRHALGGRPVLLTVGALTKRKGHLLVLEALPRILRRFPEAVYLIVGEGYMRQALEREIRERGLLRSVILAGACPNGELPDYYDACDVFLLPNRRDGSVVEGFGIVYLEANARGKPVIGIREAGVPEAVLDGVTGCLLDRYDAGLLADAVVGLLSEPDRAARLGREGRRRSLTDFGYERLGRELAGSLEACGVGCPREEVLHHEI